MAGGVLAENSVSLGRARGGGLCAFWGSEVTLEDIRVLDNQARDGAGLYIRTEGSLEVERGLFVGNIASSSGGAVGVYDSTASVTHAVFAGNSADASGGALAITDSPVELSQATLVGNQAGADGGGIDLRDGADLVATGLVLAENTASSGGGIASASSSATFEYVDAWGNVPDDYAGLVDPTGADGNTSVDPQLLDVSAPDPLDWDLHLATTSPLVDAGADLDPDGSPSDIGAFGGPDADAWDLDRDGFPAWWMPGPYDSATYPGLGWDCDDLDPDVYPGDGC